MDFTKRFEFSSTNDDLGVLSGMFWKLGGNSLTSAQSIGSTNNNDVVFISNNTERFRIQSAGNIILTSSIYGSDNLPSGNFTSRVLFDGTNNSLDWLGRNWYNNAGLIVGNYAGTDIYFQSGSGKVGIGTTTPSEKLQISNGNVYIPGGVLGIQMAINGNYSISAANKVQIGTALEIYTATTGDRIAFGMGSSNGEWKLTNAATLELTAKYNTHIFIDNNSNEIARFTTSTNAPRAGFGVNSPTSPVDITASTTAAASLRLRAGTAPTSPNDGDIWYDGTNIKIRVGGTTKTFTIV